MRRSTASNIQSGSKKADEKVVNKGKEQKEEEQSVFDVIGELKLFNKEQKEVSLQITPLKKPPKPKPLKEFVYMLKSKYQGRPNTVFFHYPKICQKQTPKKVLPYLKKVKWLDLPKL